MRYFWMSFVFFAGAQSGFGSAYDTAVMADHPVLYLRLSAPRYSGVEKDLSGRGHLGRYLPRHGVRQKTRMPNGDVATVFNGTTQYLEVASDAELSVPSGGALTIEAWIRPDTLQFPRSESDGYVHWAGKGEPGEQEYALRMYSLVNSAARPNRISGYVFNLEGGLGSGSYFQDTLQAAKWIHVALVINTQNVLIYRDGMLRDTTPLSQFHVVPEAGGAPLRIATRDFRSFFKGAIGKFAIYRRALPAARLQLHVAKMR